jgi:hypothetical protein
MSDKTKRKWNDDSKSWSTPEDRQDVTLGTSCHELTKLSIIRTATEKVLVPVIQYHSVVSG